MIKWLGALIGGLIFNIPGAILGFFFGLFIDAQNKVSPGVQSRQQNQAVFYRTVFSLMGYIAKADGRVSEAEILSAEQIMRQMGLHGKNREEAIAYFRAGAQPDFDLDATLLNFKVGPGRSGRMRQFLMVSLITICLADGSIAPIEKEQLEKIALGIGMQPGALDRLISMIFAQQQFYERGQSSQGGGYYQQGSHSQARPDELKLAYQALGVEPSATDADVKRAHRKLMKEYHPDKLMSQGLPEDMIKVATEKAQEVQAAYDLIKRSRR